MSNLRKEVFERLLHLQMILHRYQMQNLKNWGPFSNPRRGQGRILSILKMKPEISQKELTYLLDMSKQSLAELLSKLEKSGYIMREPSEEDRRVSNIKLTDKGAAAASEMEDEAQDMGDLLDCLSDEEVNTLNEYLKRIFEHYDETFAGEGFEMRKRMLERFMEEHGGRFGEHGPFDRGGFFGFRGGWDRRFPGGWGGRPEDDDKKGGR